MKNQTLEIKSSSLDKALSLTYETLQKTSEKKDIYRVSLRSVEMGMCDSHVFTYIFDVLSLTKKKVSSEFDMSVIGGKV